MDAQEVHFPEDDLRIVGQALKKAAVAGEFDYAEAWCRVKSRKYGHVFQCFPVWYAKANGARYARFRKLSESICFPDNIGLPGRCAHNMSAEWCDDVMAMTPSSFVRLDAATASGLRTTVAVPAVIERVTRVVFVFCREVVVKEDPAMIRTLTTIIHQFVRDHASPVDLTGLADAYKTFAESPYLGMPSPQAQQVQAPQVVPTQAPRQASTAPFPAFPSAAAGFRPTGTDLLASAASMVARMPYSSGPYSPTSSSDSDTAVTVSKKHARDEVNFTRSQRVCIADVLSAN
jgi:hypothetical protein